MRITGARLPDGRTREVRIEDGSIAAIEETVDGDVTLDATGYQLLPGAVDAHVHFRQPGAPHKETWARGSRAAAAGGVTTVIDQPNTQPPTTDGSRFREKQTIADRDAVVDFGINGGVTAEWEPDSLFAEPITALGEVFMADSTGEYGIDRQLLADAMARAPAAQVPVSVHAEDADKFDESVRSRSDPDAWSAYRPAAAERAAVKTAIDVATSHGTDLHLAHASTPEAIDAIDAAGATCEVTPHHLFLSRDDLDRLGTHGRMNPPLRSETRRREVFERVIDGTVDMIATDHAPHTIAEKNTDIWAAPSGVPGVETMLPLLLAHIEESDLTLERVVDVTARHPADRFGLETKGHLMPGADADLVLVDLDAVEPIRGTALQTGCGWTPFEGMPGVFPAVTFVRGTIAHVEPDTSLVIPDVHREQAPPDGQNVTAAD